MNLRITNGNKSKNLRRTLSRIKWILKNGGSWRSLPEYFGNWNSVYRYLYRLQEKQVFENIFNELTKESDMQDVSIDSTFVSVQRSALGAKCGKCKWHNRLLRNSSQSSNWNAVSYLLTKPILLQNLSIT